MAVASTLLGSVLLSTTSTARALDLVIFAEISTNLKIAVVLVGRLLPPKLLQRGLTGLGLKRAATIVQDGSAMTNDELNARLQSLSGGKMGMFLRYRYLALALAVNMPGNVILGGGGGIAMMAGLSRLFDPLPFLLTVLLAVLPVPLLFYVGNL